MGMSLLTEVAVLIAGVLIGMFVWNLKIKRESNRRRQIPAHWPISWRLLVNSRERHVWAWLSKVMFDHQIMLKMPVSRFTMPTDSESVKDWFDLLNGIYCTFTICTPEGRVIGCVDVQDARNNSQFQQRVKYNLLQQCGMTYWVVDPENFPKLTKIRTAFLGDEAVKGDEREILQARFKEDDGSNAFHLTDNERHEAELLRGEDFPETHVPEGWEQNSFISQPDSRKAPL